MMSYMNIDSISDLSQKKMVKNNSNAKMEKVAVEFEKIFARRLVSTLIKDSFKMSDKNALMGQSNNLYRRYIVKTLANELAKQRKLGIANIITRYEGNLSQKP